MANRPDDVYVERKGPLAIRRRRPTDSPVIIAIVVGSGAERRTLTGSDVYFLVAGSIVLVVGAVQVAFPRWVYNLARRRNEGRPPISQDVRGASPEWTRNLGILQVCLGVFLIYASIYL
jgi:hypothetical protein